MAPSFMLALTLAHLLISFACGQMNNTSPMSCPVTQTQQLTVDGCPVFVHDVTGAKDFVIEPLMCITENISNVFPQIDPLTQQMFVSVPVTLRDDSMFAEITNQLQHLSPNSINFATVSDISVSMDASSKCVKALMFLWSPDEPVGYLRLGSTKDSANCRVFFLNSKHSVFDAINGAIVTAKVQIGIAQIQLNYKLMLHNQTFFYPEFYGSKFDCWSNCDNLQFLQPVIYGKCIARVHQRQDVNEIFYVEPMLCPKNIGINESLIYDYNRAMYYLKLDVDLQNNITLNAVENALANLSPTNVSFMQLWRAEIAVSSFLRSLYDIGPLMVSRDWRSGQVRVYCKTGPDCESLRSNMSVNPLSFWSHVNFDLTSHTPNQCMVKSGHFFYNILLPKVSNIGLINSTREIVAKLYQTKTVDGRQYAIIQQRMSASVSFARTWDEYEFGFGDETNFWIGLSTIHSLSINGVTFRMETKLMNGSEHHQEYANFKVGDASTNYTMTYGGIVVSRSSNSYDAMTGNNKMQFSTKDRDNDKWIYYSCTSHAGGVYEDGGWWFNNCDAGSLPNGRYGDAIWFLNQWVYIREIRLMLQI